MFCSLGWRWLVPTLWVREMSIHPDQPVHAVLVMDNSLSMGYQRMDNTTLLDEAKNRAKEFIGKLPAGSRVSVLPACGSAPRVRPRGL